MVLLSTDLQKTWISSEKDTRISAIFASFPIFWFCSRDISNLNNIHIAPTHSGLSQKIHLSKLLTFRIGNFFWRVRRDTLSTFALSWRQSNGQCRFEGLIYKKKVDRKSNTLTSSRTLMESQDSLDYFKGYKSVARLVSLVFTISYLFCMRFAKFSVHAAIFPL